MVQPHRDPELQEPGRGPDWLTQLFERKMANGGRPDHEAALTALARMDALLAKTEPVFQSEEEIEAFLDAAGPVWHIADWPLVPWSYWEARGAGPYRR
jgi:hypothetical protein